MSTSNVAVLRDMLLADYSDLDRRLTRRLGSADLASDVLHETYLRVEGISEIEAVRSPKAYLLRIALNIANDRRRVENRRLTVDEVDALLDIPDERPDAARVIEDRSELSLLKRAIAELPERRRNVLLLSRVEGLPNREIAARLGLTVRTIETDLKQAVEHCAEKMKRSCSDKFGFHRSGSSYLKRDVDRGKRPATGACGKALGRDKARPTDRSIGSINP